MYSEQIRRLCANYTNLQTDEVDIIVHKSDMLQTIADLAQANVFIDCPHQNGYSMVVIAEAIPSTTESIYQKQVVGKLIYEAYEPAVFRSYRTSKPIMMNRAVTHEGNHVSQNVTPILNRDSKPIGLMILEKDVTIQVNHEQQIKILSQTTEQMGQTFWDIVTRQPAVPDVIEEALILLQGNGNIIYSNNCAMNIIDKHEKSKVSNQYLHSRNISDIFPFIDLNELTKHELHQQEINYEGQIYHFRSVILNHTGKNKTILLYFKDLTDLRNKERQLMVKSAVIQEIHHRVKNNLQTIASLLRLQMKRSNPQDMQLQFEESIDRVLSIAAVHEHLSYSGIDNIEMTPIIKKITNMLISNFNGNGEQLVDVDYEIEPIILSSKQAVSITMIITELVQNSLKHGFKNRDKGQITVQCKQENHRISLHIADDGVGFDHHNHHERLGLEIVNTLTQYDLLGEINIASIDGSGTMAQIIFPLEEEVKV